MSLWSRAPRQVYEVYGEDDHFLDEGAPPSECAVRELDASVEDSRQGRLLGLALLAAVTLGAAVLVLLHVSHTPPTRQPVAERHAFSGAERPALPDVPTTAPPQVHEPLHTDRHARASTPPPARPRRHRPRIAGGHAEPPKILAPGHVGGQPSAAPARAANEFDFER